MAAEEAGDGQLVFFGGEGAGGIDQPSARPDGEGGVVQDLVLPGGAKADIVDAPAGKGLRLFPEHPLAGARRIDEHGVGPSGKRPAQPPGVSGRHDGVAHAAPLEVLLQDAGARGHVFVAPQHAFSAHGGGQLCRFAARRGAEIEHPFARPRRQHGGRNGGRRLLHIICPGVVQRIAARLEGRIPLRRQAEHVRREGRRGQRQREKRQERACVGL